MTFSVRFHQRSTHWVSVVVHSSRRTMRARLTRLGHNSSHTDAACWQANCPGRDNCVAEIHLALTHLTLDVIAHESAHAAFHRTVLLGVPKDDDEFQEYVAQDAGVLTDAILAFLDKEKVVVRYAVAPRRRIVSTRGA